MEIWVIWLIATALLVIIELITGVVASFCLAIGCLAAMIVSVTGFALETQLAALAIGTATSFIFLSPLIRKWQAKKAEAGASVNSNMDALIGREVVVSQDIPEGGEPGRIRIDGDNWQAVSKDGRAIVAGTRVKVVAYNSIILEVEVKE